MPLAAEISGTGMNMEPFGWSTKRPVRPLTVSFGSFSGKGTQLGGVDVKSNLQPSRNSVYGTRPVEGSSIAKTTSTRVTLAPTPAGTLVAEYLPSGGLNDVRLPRQVGEGGGGGEGGLGDGGGELGDGGGDEGGVNSHLASMASSLC